MTASLRVLHLVNHLRKTGNGIVNATVDLACGQQALGAQVSVASTGGELVELLAAHDVRHFVVPAGRRLGQLHRASLSLDGLLRELRPDVVHAHMIAPALLAFAAKRSRGFRLVTTVHNDFQLGAILMAVGDRIIAVSQASLDSLRQRGLPVRKLRLIRNATLGSARSATAADSLPRVLSQPAILTVCGLYRRKGVDVLIEAFHAIAQDLPAAHLYIVGEGPDRLQFERLAASGVGASRIHFEGFQPNPRSYMQAADVFVLASRREPFGLVLGEARAAGNAIIGSDVDGIPEVLDYGMAGYLVPPGKPTMLACALRQLLTKPTEREFWRSRAILNLDWLSVGRMCRETLDLYHELLRATAYVRATEVLPESHGGSPLHF